MKRLPKASSKTSTAWTLPALTALAAFSLIAAPQAALAQTGVQPASAPRLLSAKTLSQIAALEAEAKSRTPIEQKISTPLLFSLKMARGQAIAPGIPRQRTNVVVDKSGLTLVDIDAKVTPAFLSALGHAGGKVIGGSVQFGQVRAQLPLSAVETLAGLSDVHSIKPAVKWTLQNPGSVKGSMGETQRRAALRAHLPGLLAQNILGINFADSASTSSVGSVIDEADATHQADKARSLFKIDGTGIKVGVISDSLDNGNNVYPDALASGDVSTVTVIPGQDGGAGTAEGLAMLEDVHHLAPGAQLYFATGTSGEAQFASNIIALQQAGCKIIVDDLGYNDEPPFQDNVIAQAINTVTASGVDYFAADANDGHLGSLTAGQNGVWEGDFNSSGSSGSYNDGLVHQFDAAGDEMDPMHLPFGQSDVELFWSDALGQSANDYDLFIVDSSGNVVASSTDPQNGTQDPHETATANDGDSAVIIKNNGDARFLHIDLDAAYSTFEIATDGRMRGHDAAENCLSVGATPATTSQSSGGPSGPYPNPFTSSNVVEVFTDDGPRHVFYAPDGTPVTPGNFSSTGGKILPKPEFTAADGTSNTLTPAEVGEGKEALSPFFGTSCAAPHAAAIATLVLSYNPTLSRAQVLSILQSTATDIMAPGFDNVSGPGILNALAALQATPAPASAGPTNLTAKVSGNAIVLTWTAATGTVKSYSVYRGTTAGGETFYKTANTPMTFTNTYVTPGTTYYYVIKAVTSTGTSPASNEASATVPLTIPAAPTNLTATASNGVITLAWTPSSGPVSTYALYRGTTSGGETFYKYPEKTNSFVNTYVTAGTKYYYTVKAINKAGTSPASNEASATP